MKILREIHGLPLTWRTATVKISQEFRMFSGKFAMLYVRKV